LKVVLKFSIAFSVIGQTKFNQIEKLLLTN